MCDVRWEFYPLVAECGQSRAWLQIQADLQRAPSTIDAYGRALEDFFRFSKQQGIEPLSADVVHVARYVRGMAEWDNPHRATLSEPGRGLANATMQLRITVLRLFFVRLIELGVRADNPVVIANSSHVVHEGGSG